MAPAQILRALGSSPLCIISKCGEITEKVAAKFVEVCAE